MPVVITISDLHEILHFITYGNDKKRESVQEKHERRFNWKIFQERIGFLLFIFGFVTTGIGIFLCVIIIKTGFVEECPIVYSVNDRPEGFLLPTGTDCYVWQYNLFLSPACACVFSA